MKDYEIVFWLIFAVIVATTIWGYKEALRYSSRDHERTLRNWFVMGAVVGISIGMWILGRYHDIQSSVPFFVIGLIGYFMAVSQPDNDKRTGK